ncbi:MAG: hypothetical protein P4M11_11055 [Candidatus Pacebacteria bacterium]|nr:hypothetical protein [Candidatus Paceibacterota bacterium]
MSAILSWVTETAIRRMKKNKSRPQLAEVLSVCSHIVPLAVEPHMVFLTCFLTFEAASEDEYGLIRSVCTIVANTSSCAGAEAFDVYKRAQVQLMQLTCVAPLQYLEGIVQALASVIQKVTFDEVIVASMLEKAVVLLQVYAQSHEADKLPSVFRSLALIGYLCYFFDFEKLKTLKFRSETDEPFSKQLFDICSALYVLFKENEEGRDRVLESISYIWLRYNYLLTECEDMLLQALRRCDSPPSIKRTLQMIHKLFQGNGSRTATMKARPLVNEAQIALLVPKLFDKLEQYARHRNDEVRYWSFTLIRLFSDKGFANHTKVWLRV